MKITPLDVQKKEFSKSLRGYNQTEVATFHGLIMQTMEDMIQMQLDAEDRIRTLEGEIQRYRDMEQTIHDAVILAQKTSEDMLRVAESEAKHILERAGIEREERIKRANEEVVEVLRKREQAQFALDAFKSRFKALVQEQERWLETLDE